MNYPPLPKLEIIREAENQDDDYIVAPTLNGKDYCVSIYLAEDKELRRQQLEAIVSACNSYPQAIETIKKAVELIDNHEGLQGYQLLAQFLKENQ